MDTVYLIVAMLLNIETGIVEPRHHAAYKFDTLPECMQFVNSQYEGLYGGLVYKLQEEGKVTTQIINIGCAEMSEQDALDFMKEHEIKPGVGA
tara:strand:- start:476 stop:754 length:279 start_codon:yes stop_codon:yes gene_type:complete